MKTVALITGASGGIGRATAIALGKLRYCLALVSRSRTDLEQTATQMGAKDALILPADISNPAQCQKVIDQTIEHFGRLDALINIAGFAPAVSIEEMSLEQWREVIDTNLSAVFYMTKYAWPHLKLAAQTRAPAVIVNISSMAARDPFNGFAAYGAAKAALHTFGLVAAREGQGDQIAVHTIAPGAVETAMLRKLLTPEQLPSDKTLTAEEVAAVVVQCVTGQLRHTSGEVIYVHKTP